MSDESGAATTGSGGASPLPASVERYRVSRRFGNVTKKPIGGPPELTKLHHRLIALMVHGLERPLPHFPDVAPNEPLALEAAAVILRMRLRNARDLATWPIFQKALSKELAALRNGAKAKALHAVIAQIDGPTKKAADRKVILEAADRILGDEIGKPTAAAVNVNVQVNNQNISPGYIIKLPAPKTDAKTIEHKVEEGTER